MTNPSTPSSGVTEGKAESGEYDAAGVDSVARLMYLTWDHVAEPTRSLYRQGAVAVLDAYFATAQLPAPADEGKADTPEPEPSVIEMTTRLAGQQQCAMGNHVWTPWLLLPSDSYVTCCARTGCGHDVRYDL